MAEATTAGTAADMFSAAMRLMSSNPRCAQCLMGCGRVSAKDSTSCAMVCASPGAPPPGGKYGGNVAYSYYPYGCYWHTVTGSVYYNSDPAGAPNVFAQPLCAGAALHAHPHGPITAIAPRTLGHRQVRQQRRPRPALQAV